MLRFGSCTILSKQLFINWNKELDLILKRILKKTEKLSGERVGGS